MCQRAFEMLTLVFGESMKSRTQVQLWYNRFKEGREDISDDVRPCLPSTSTIDENKGSNCIKFCGEKLN